MKLESIRSIRVLQHPRFAVLAEPFLTFPAKNVCRDLVIFLNCDSALNDDRASTADFTYSPECCLRYVVAQAESNVGTVAELAGSIGHCAITTGHYFIIHDWADVAIAGLLIPTLPQSVYLYNPGVLPRNLRPMRLSRSLTPLTVLPTITANGGAFMANEGI
jgi:hypothetical protein